MKDAITGGVGVGTSDSKSIARLKWRCWPGCNNLKSHSERKKNAPKFIHMAGSRPTIAGFYSDTSVSCCVGVLTDQFAAVTAFPQGKELREQSLHSLISKVMCNHFHHIHYKSLCHIHPRGKGPIQGYEYQEIESLGSISEAFYLNC